MIWKEVEIGKIFSFVRNGMSIKQGEGMAGLPITRIETIWNCEIDTSRLGYANLTEEVLGKAEDYLLESGDILMSHINSPKHLGKSAVYKGVPDKLIHGMNLLCLRPNKDQADPKFIHYYLNSDLFKNKVLSISNQSVNQASFSAGNLKKIRIPLPPLEDQKRIAAILDAADALRQKDRALIAKYEELTQSLFLDMFGDPVRNPKGWVIKDFEYFVSFDTRMTKDFDKYAEFPHIGIANIEQNTGKLVNYKKVKEEGIISGKYLFSPEHIIYSKIRPNLNKVALPDFHGLASADSYPLLVKKENSNKYFFAYLLRSKVFIDFILSHSSRTNIPKANKDQLKMFKGIAPPVALQHKFGDRFQQIEKQKQLAQQSLQKSEELFNSLLQRAFKGDLTDTSSSPPLTRSHAELVSASVLP
jgi:type I restriction enzyme, S subunit